MGGFAVKRLSFAYRSDMDLETLRQHWALILAGSIAMAVLVFVLMRLVQDSPRGRLAAEVGQLRRTEKAARKAAKKVLKATSTVHRLQSRAERVRPNKLEEQQGRLGDARALQKIADDQVLIARNRVRQIILDEIPPGRQAAMQKRLLPHADRGDAPCTTGG